jgi:hypothetical protein
MRYTILVGEWGLLARNLRKAKIPFKVIQPDDRQPGSIFQEMREKVKSAGYRLTYLTIKEPFNFVKALLILEENKDEWYAIAEYKNIIKVRPI